MNLSTLQKVEVISKKTRVIALIRDAIQAGTIQSGDLLVEAKIAQQLGVGQGLIREALIELEQSGLVERTPFCGTQVPILTNDDARRILDVRIELEPLAIRLAAKTIAKHDIVELEKIVRKARREWKNANPDGFLQHQLDFRRKLWALSANKYLIQTLERLAGPLYALYLRGAENREWFARTIDLCLVHMDAVLGHLRNGAGAPAARATKSFLVKVQAMLDEKPKS